MIDIKVFKDIWFIAIGVRGDYEAEFLVYALEGVEADGSPLYHQKDVRSWPAPTDHICDAELFLHGRVKWDGCSDWHFDEQDRIRLHGCAREDLTALGEVMARCWDWTAELCENWGGD